MAESESEFLKPQTPIPIEIVSDEEMAIIEAALASATRSLSSSSASSCSAHLQHNARSITSITLLSKRLDFQAEIEDFSGGSGVMCTTLNQNKKKTKLNESLLHRFRRKKGLFVTDVTSMEMAESESEFLKPQTTIPIEIVSDEEMAIIEAALASATRSLSSSSASSCSDHLQHNARSITSITLLSKRLDFQAEIEDFSGGSGVMCTTLNQNKKKTKLNESLLHRFRRKKGLFVTDVTSMEMAESESEFLKPQTTIPIEIVSDEEMAIIEAALASATRSLSSSSASSCSDHLQHNARSITSITLLSKRLDFQAEIEDFSGGSGVMCTTLNQNKKKTKLNESLLHRFRRKKGLFVTDVTSMEMAESESEFLKPQTTIPIEIVSDEEMAIIEAALASATRSLSSSSASSCSDHLQHNARSITSITLLSKRLDFQAEIEDFSGGSGVMCTTLNQNKKKTKLNESLLHRFRRKKGLFVTDVTSTEMAESESEFLKPQTTIPIEIVSDEEMAIIEAALASATRSLSSSSASSCSDHLQHNARSITSITLLSKRLDFQAEIEDFSGGSGVMCTTLNQNKKKTKLNESLLHRFRRKKGLFVTDVTSTEMAESESEFLKPQTPIPIEIVSDEEMAIIEAALASATRSLSSSSASSCSAHLQHNARSITSITLRSKRLDFPAEIEDFSGGSGVVCTTLNQNKKKTKLNESLLHRFRSKKGLFVTDVTSTEWCEKQKEFFLTLGTPKASKAMQAGSARHAVLEEEVIKRVKISIASAEEAWALKMINFIHGADQLLFDGLTRELPVIGFAEGVCMVGVIDEIRMTMIESKLVPTLVETKTRSLEKLPSEPQRRNRRLQLMCYKLLWDKLAADKFPSRRFLELFSLNPNYILSEKIRDNTAKSGFPAETFDDILRYYQNTCLQLPESDSQLLLRYEYQKDQSLIGEDQFLYDSDWVNGQIRQCLEFWRGEREASYTPEEERWKCKYCKYAPLCPVNTKPTDTQTTRSTQN